MNGENYWEANQSGHYKIRVEMGWGDQTLYRWNGKIKIEGGSLTDIDTCFRGRNVLSPTQREASKIEQINDIASQAEMLSKKKCSLHVIQWEISQHFIHALRQLL